MAARAAVAHEAELEGRGRFGARNGPFGHIGAAEVMPYLTLIVAHHFPDPPLFGDMLSEHEFALAYGTRMLQRDASDVVWVSVDDLAGELGRSRSATMNALANLRQHGHLKGLETLR